MEKLINPFAPEPKLEVNMFEAAKELQWQIDEARLLENALAHRRAVLAAMAILEPINELLGGKRVIIHALEAYALNPPGPSYALDRPELQIGELWLRANYDGIAHFKAEGSVVLNSLCLDVSEVKILRDSDHGQTSSALGDGRSVVIPVQSVETVMAA